MSPGEEKAWEILAGLKPDAVCRNAGVAFDEATGLYAVRSCGMDFYISPHDGKVTGNSPDSSILLNRLGYFFRLSVPWYLISAKDISLTERFVKPENLKGGQLFFRGSHVLPLDKVAEKFGQDVEGFVEKGARFGGEALNHGDASFRFFPFPRFPVALILWTADEEFPSRVDLLFDSTCELQLPLDIIWSIAMMSLLLML